ncbi:hypothetical protein MTR67_039921 [Solanum verrucosum]|uniref:Uncharacterized protein n=1 Tax=Solanum verrucosum TaxID=315347 RepID=A0AAF0UJ59_SOLVR|nr:hypothetical protein MTR67_039921 [Solanum verrucosum]
MDFFLNLALFRQGGAADQQSSKRAEKLLSSRLPALIFEEVALDTRDIQERPDLDPQVSMVILFNISFYSSNNRERVKTKSTLSRRFARSFLVACYLETSLLAGAGVERALRERIVWRGERCQGGRRRPQVLATDALIIQLTPCCQSVLAVMLAKAGVSVGFTYYWI